jgi:hypothetical protein
LRQAPAAKKQENRSLKKKPVLYRPVGCGLRPRTRVSGFWFFFLIVHLAETRFASLLGLDFLPYTPPMTKRARFGGFHGLNSPPVPSDVLKNGRVVPNWRLGLGVAASLASDFRFNGVLFFGGHIFRQLKCRTKLLNFLGQ